MKKEKDIKMSLAEYMDKNTTKALDSKLTKETINLVGTLIGVIIAVCLFFLCLKVFEIHEIAGYISIVISIVFFVFFFIVPFVRLKKQESFFVRNVKYSNYRKAKKHNQQLRHKLADQIIDLVSNTEDTTWYNETKAGKLAIARQTNNEKELREVLADIYNTDIKKATNKIITDFAVKVGLSTTVSQNAILDVTFISLFELEMIKQIVYLYGFRPSNYELTKIYKTVIANAVVSYGTQNAAASIITKIGQASTTSLLGSIVGSLATAVGQGLLNSALTVAIGLQTRKYLIKEYRLAETLEDVELTEDDQKYEEAILKEVKTKVEMATKKKETKTDN